MRIADNRAATPQLPLWDDQPAHTPARVRHSLRARRVAVRIHAGGVVELVVPHGTSERQARAFLESRSDWVRTHVERRRAASQPEAVFPPAIIDPGLLGQSWRVFQAGGTGSLRVREVGGVLELRGSGSREFMRRALRRWLLRRAVTVLQPMLGALAEQYGFHFSAMSVRCQRTRWGSCSSRGVISLNLALVFQPAEVVRYLLCHELAHTHHMNHSAAFWRCVAACEPRYRELDRALRDGWSRVPAWLREQA